LLLLVSLLGGGLCGCDTAINSGIRSSHTTMGDTGSRLEAPTSSNAVAVEEPRAVSQAGEETPSTPQPPSAALPAADSPLRSRVRTRRVGKNTIYDITFDDLKLDMPLGTLFDRSMLTPQAEQLDGKHISLKGFIYAGGVFQSTGIKSFPFVMNTQCKFGPQGLAYCVILVDLVEGVTTDFTTSPVTVEGKLSVRPFNADGFTWSVYHMEGLRVY
jgi:hypothetical protein